MGANPARIRRARNPRPTVARLVLTLSGGGDVKHVGRPRPIVCFEPPPEAGDARLSAWPCEHLALEAVLVNMGSAWMHAFDNER